MKSLSKQLTNTHRHALACLALAAAGLAGEVQASLVASTVIDKNGHPVLDAVLFATPLDTPLPAAPPAETVVVAQENYRFLPYVSVIRAGSSVHFTNRDKHEHHLKSFSPAKSFEIRVNSKRDEAPPVLFDKAGEVALVCHFHDWMRGYVFVVDTPYFTKTDKAGNALLINLPDGKYEIKIWAPNMLGAPLTQTVHLKSSTTTALNFQLNFVPKLDPGPRQPKKAIDYQY